MERILKVTKKSGNRERDVGCCLYETVSRPPFFPATMLLLKAGKKGGVWMPLRKSTNGIACLAPSLLPGHYAIIKGREEGRGVEGSG